MLKIKMHDNVKKPEAEQEKSKTSAQKNETLTRKDRTKVC
jgi:hypothetical protein